MSIYDHRSAEDEIMDDLSYEGEILNQTLRELDTINRLLGGNHVTLNGIKKLIDPSLDKTWKIIDVGCGGGDILKLIANWARKSNIKVELQGVDANPNVIKYAEENCSGYSEISFRADNIFSDEFKKMDCDILTATLFLHHFDDQELSQLFTQFQKQAKIGIVVNDLHRHWLAYRSINLLTGLFSKSSMVKNDAGISVLRSFRKTDWIKILGNVDVSNFKLTWMWAFRWQLIIDVRK